MHEREGTARALRQGARDLLHRLRPDGRQPPRRPLHRPDGDGAHAARRPPSDLPRRRRHGYGRRPDGPHRHAQDADGRGHRAQLRVLQEADCPLHRLLGWQGHHGQQRRLAPEAQLHRPPARRRRLLHRQPHARGRVLQAALGEGPDLPRVQLHGHAGLRLPRAQPPLRLQA